MMGRHTGSGVELNAGVSHSSPAPAASPWKGECIRCSGGTIMRNGAFMASSGWQRAEPGGGLAPLAVASVIVAFYYL